MKNEYFISIFLDTRRAKKNGKYPVKLRVFTPEPRKQKFYPTSFELTEKDFNSSYNSLKPRIEYKELKNKMVAIETKANEVAATLNPFTFEQFEKKLYRKAGDGIRLKFLYSDTIIQLNKRYQIGTASSYELAEKSIKDFIENKQRKNYDKTTLYDITVSWLKDFEFYMVESKKRSITTVGIYLRTLRAVYNSAIEQKEIEPEFYPFGKKKYQIPATKNVRKALSKEQLNILFNAEPQTPEQEKAKDFWFFSYACNGMNIKDIALLKHNDIKDGRFHFFRAKTKLTTKGNLKPITGFLNDYAKSIIAKYSREESNPENFVFDIITPSLSVNEQKDKIKNFTRFINQHVKKICLNNNLPADVSTYWARHSFATNSIRKGASMEFIRESLGHSNLKTTQNYFAGFDDNTKKEFANELMNFD